jgi:hypothetical protein
MNDEKIWLAGCVYMSELYDTWQRALHNLSAFISNTYSVQFASTYACNNNAARKPFMEEHIIKTEDFASVVFMTGSKIELQLTLSSFYGPYYLVYFHIESGILSNSSMEPFEFFIDFASRVKEIGKIEYGILNPMLFYPSDFFMLSFTLDRDRPSDSEVQQARRWKAKRARYTQTVWDVFWGNVFNKEIATEQIIREVKEMVGEENVIDSDGIIFVFLPVKLREWAHRDRKAIMLRDALTRILDRNNLLMETAVLGSPVPEAVARRLAERESPEPYKGPSYVESYLAEGSKTVKKEIDKRFQMSTSGISYSGNDKFKLAIDDERRFVAAVNSKGTVVLYDPSKHPSNMAFGQRLDVHPEEHQCGKCGGSIFKIAVGYEYPADTEGPDDISSFALAGKCVQCGTIQVIFDDETA